MKKIKVFPGAAVIYDSDLEKQGISFSSNSGDMVLEVEATPQNIKKYMKDKKFPTLKKPKK